MTDATVEWLLGAGGKALDPVNGAALFLRDVTVQTGIIVPPPFDYTQAPQLVAVLKALPPTTKLFLFGDSCGANWFSWLAQAIYPRRIDYAGLVQPSIYCNGGCPAIPGNVALVDVFYTDFLSLPFPGLGSYKPQLAVPPSGTITYPGIYTGNNDRTTIRYIYAPAPHPNDDSAVVQGIMMNRIKVALVT